MKMTEIIVAGISSSGFPDTVLSLFGRHRYALVCSQAMLDLVKEQEEIDQPLDWIPIVPVEACFKSIEEKLDDCDVIVLTSGDPLFYGLGTRLKKRFDSERISFIPAASYMQICFSRFGVSWDDTEFVSLHGRPLSLLSQKLNAEKLFIYTDPKNSPDQIAKYLERHLNSEDIKQCRLSIGERLGTVNERLVSGDVHEIAKMTFSQPNCLILQNPKALSESKKFRFGLQEKDIQHSRGLITKDEVRAAVLHRLCLPETGVLWDIGAGSGSISLEAARLFPSLSIYAVEKEKQQLVNIRSNKNLYQCRNLSVIDGMAPEILQGLEQPDRVFIGGSGGELDTIISHVANVCKSHTIIVVTAVLERTAKHAPELLFNNGFDVDVSLLETTRYRYPLDDKKKFNPIHIICGKNKK